MVLDAIGAQNRKGPPGVGKLPAKGPDLRLVVEAEMPGVLHVNEQRLLVGVVRQQFRPHYYIGGLVEVDGVQSVFGLISYVEAQILDHLRHQHERGNHLDLVFDDFIAAELGKFRQHILSAAGHAFLLVLDQQSGGGRVHRLGRL